MSKVRIGDVFMEFLMRFVGRKKFWMTSWFLGFALSSFLVPIVPAVVLARSKALSQLSAIEQGNSFEGDSGPKGSQPQIPTAPVSSQPDPESFEDEYYVLSVRVSMDPGMSFIQRTAIVRTGADIIEPDVKEPRTGIIKVILHENEIGRIVALGGLGIRIEERTSLKQLLIQAFPQGVPGGMPSGYEKYRTTSKVVEELRNLARNNAGLVSFFQLGISVKGRPLYGVRLSAPNRKESSAMGPKPGIFFCGVHHAREILTSEVPLLLAQHLTQKYRQGDARIRRLLETREVYIVPIVNPDGKVYDTAQGRFEGWRKNRRPNGDGTVGVDPNRNYGGPGWGGPGSSPNPGSETYHGSSAFSEPENQAVRDFVAGHPNINVLLSYHSYSELILYPWGHTLEPVPNQRDRAVFETMAQRMSQWNGYQPMPGHDLYLASGDTNDWAYALRPDHPIFAFTFELSPSRGLGMSGFYPKPDMIQKVFDANLEPALYLIEYADDPYRVLSEPLVHP
ncbi:MAG: zinc carboxypeptidase [Elusimicrobia bacterium]|nr:zinc carboxypeptidase [Elusimicrobiota bacterium]